MNGYQSARRENHNVPRHLTSGAKFLEKAEYSQAVHEARRVLAEDPNHLGGLELLARAQWRAGDFELALDSLRHLIRLNPYEPGYHFMRAVALRTLGHYGEALRAFGRCVEHGADPLIESAAASIRELESWQEEVIAELLRSDKTFERAYRADPIQACNSRGFAFAAEDCGLAIRLSAHTDSAAVEWGRPS